MNVSFIVLVKYLWHCFNRTLSEPVSEFERIWNPAECPNKPIVWYYKMFFFHPHARAHHLISVIDWIDLWIQSNVYTVYIFRWKYWSPWHLGKNILRYYTNLLKCDETGTNILTSSRLRHFVILTTEAEDYFPVMLKRLRQRLCAQM